MEANGGKHDRGPMSPEALCQSSPQGWDGK
jgi:hypothetical protein